MPTPRERGEQITVELRCVRHMMRLYLFGSHIFPVSREDEPYLKEAKTLKKIITLDELPGEWANATRRDPTLPSMEEIEQIATGVFQTLDPKSREAHTEVGREIISTHRARRTQH